MDFGFLVHQKEPLFLDVSSHLYERVCPSVCPSVCWSVRWSVCPSVHPSICLSVGPSIGPSFGPSVTRLFFEFGKSLITDLYDGYKVERRHMHAHMHTDTHTQTYTLSMLNARFPTFRLDHYRRTDGRTDGPTDQWSDGRTKPLMELRVHN